MFTKIISKVMYFPINKQAHKFSKLLQLSITALAGKELEALFSIEVSPRATKRCVAGQKFPASYEYSKPQLLTM
jgi:hypothetical protein